MQRIIPGRLETYTPVTNSQLQQLLPYAQQAIHTIDRTKGPLAGRTDTEPTGPYFTSEEVRRLLWLSDTTSVDTLKSSTLSVEGDRFTVANAQAGVTPELVESLRKLLKQAITENVIVPQGNINHRVIEFVVEGQQLAVKFAQMGEQNDFNTSIQTLAGTFREVTN